MSTDTQIEEPIESIYPEIRAFYRANPSLDYFPTALDRTHNFFTVLTEARDNKEIDHELARIMGR
jgi:hypothetical protein